MNVISTRTFRHKEKSLPCRAWKGAAEPSRGLPEARYTLGTAEMAMEEFARLHNLPDEWLALRRDCEGIVRDPQFWSRPELQTLARKLAVKASDILRDVITVRE